MNFFIYCFIFLVIIMAEKIAIAPCNGMSPNGLVSRVAVGDCRRENENVISICMGSTSADIDGQNDEMLKRYPIVSINGCKNGCVDKILENKGISVAKTINVEEVLKNFDVVSSDAFRLDEDGEKCVGIIKKELNETIGSLR